MGFFARSTRSGETWRRRTEAVSPAICTHPARFRSDHAVRKLFAREVDSMTKCRIKNVPFSASRYWRLCSLSLILSVTSYVVAQDAADPKPAEPKPAEPEPEETLDTTKPTNPFDLALGLASNHFFFPPVHPFAGQSVCVRRKAAKSFPNQNHNLH